MSFSILLVEDDPNDVIMVRRAFAKTDFSVALQVATDGDAAIAFLSGQGEYGDRRCHPLPTLLLLDLKLPRKSGFEVLAWLRAQPGLCRLPVVVFTSSHEHADVQRAYDLHANSYLVKPVDLPALQEVVLGIGRYWIKLNKMPSLHQQPASAWSAQ